MGAAATRLDVNMAAPMVPVSATATARSGLPLALIPAVVAPHRKPAGRLVASDSEADADGTASKEAALDPVVLIIRLLYQAKLGIVNRPSCDGMSLHARGD